MDCDYVQLCPPSDDELLDLIEAAFLEGQIDGEQLSLASAWVESKKLQEH